MFMCYLHLAILAITAASALSQSTPGLRGARLSGSQGGLSLQVDVNDNGLLNPLAAGTYESDAGIRLSGDLYLNAFEASAGLNSNITGLSLQTVVNDSGSGGHTSSHRSLSLQTDVNDNSFFNPLVAGTYESDAGIRLSGDLYLDASTSGWTFDITGGLSTRAGSKMFFVKDNSVLEDPQDAEYQTLYASVSWTVAGTIDLGAQSAAIGSLTSTHGAINMGSSASSGDLQATRGAINVGAMATSGALVAGAAISVGARATVNGAMDAGGAITLGARATANGQLNASFAVNVGAQAIVNGQIHAGAAITVGAGTSTCFLCSGAAITLGAGAQAENSDCNLSCLSSPPICTSSVGADMCPYSS
jgi:hypothetical protein